MAAPQSGSDSRTLWLLLVWGTLLACHKTDAPEAGDIQFSHHAHDGSVIDCGVTTHEYPLVITVARNRRQTGHELGHFDLGFLQEDPALPIDGDRQRFLVGVIQLSRLGAGQVHGLAGRADDPGPWTGSLERQVQPFRIVRNTITVMDGGSNLRMEMEFGGKRPHLWQGGS
jgi:hypothetical protein